MMNNKLKNRRFKLWAYNVSHRRLLLRSEKQYLDLEYEFEYHPNCTVDFEFSGVVYMDIPTDFSLLDLKFNEEKSIPKRFMEYGDLKYFELIGKNETHSIIASSCIVGESQWDNQDRLSNPGLEYDKVLIRFGDGSKGSN